MHRSPGFVTIGAYEGGRAPGSCWLRRLAVLGRGPARVSCGLAARGPLACSEAHLDRSWKPFFRPEGVSIRGLQPSPPTVHPRHTYHGARNESVELLDGGHDRSHSDASRARHLRRRTRWRVDASADLSRSKACVDRLHPRDEFPLPTGSWTCTFLLGNAQVTIPFRTNGPTGVVVDFAVCAGQDRLGPHGDCRKDESASGLPRTGPHSLQRAHPASSRLPRGNRIRRSQRLSARPEQYRPGSPGDRDPVDILCVAAPTIGPLLRIRHIWVSRHRRRSSRRGEVVQDRPILGEVGWSTAAGRTQN